MPRGRYTPPQVWGFLQQCKAKALSVREARDAVNKEFKRQPWIGNGISIGFVHKVYKSPSFTAPTPALRTGRPKKLTQQNITWLRMQVKKNSVSGEAKGPAQLAATMPHLKVSPSTITRAMRLWPDIRLVLPRKRLWLSKAHRAARLLAARRLRNLPAAFWNGITFMDEKKFSASGPDSPQRVWCLAGHEPVRQIHSSSRVGVMVWMGIGPEGIVGPVRIERALTGDGYLQVLKQADSALTNRALDDWATCHSTNKILKYLDTAHIENVRFLARVPPKLVELNLQEQVWSNIEYRVWQGNPCFSNANSLWDRIVKVCNDVRHEGVDRQWYQAMVQTIPRRMQLICNAQGKQVDVRNLQ
jgi:hypothetical protein